MAQQPSTYGAPCAHGIMFHHFHGPGHPPTEGAITADDLERLLDHVGQDRILAPAEWLARLDGGALDPRDICLTFDDGLKCQVDVALPVLQRRGLKAFWFVYTAVFEGRPVRLEVYRAFRNRFFAEREDYYEAFFERVGTAAEVTDGEIAQLLRRFPFYSRSDARYRLVRDRILSRKEYEETVDAMIDRAGSTPERLATGLWMSEEDLVRLGDSGHHIGLHSHTHPIPLADLRPETQRDEYRRNRERIVAICGREPAAMAHPANSYSEVTLSILSGLGIRCGFRSNMRCPSPRGALNPSPLELAREDHSNIMTSIRSQRGSNG